MAEFLVELTQMTMIRHRHAELEEVDLAEAPARGRATRVRLACPTTTSAMPCPPSSQACATEPSGIDRH